MYTFICIHLLVLYFCNCFILYLLLFMVITATSFVSAVDKQLGPIQDLLNWPFKVLSTPKNAASFIKYGELR